jgi:hypothetical protein
MALLSPQHQQLPQLRSSFLAQAKRGTKVDAEGSAKEEPVAAKRGRKTKAAAPAVAGEEVAEETKKKRGRMTKAEAVVMEEMAIREVR